MALLYIDEHGRYESACPLCGSRLSDPVFGTNPFRPNDERLQPYANVGLHWSCYARWSLQRRFAAAYFDHCRRLAGQHPTWSVLMADQRVLVRQSREQQRVAILLAETGSALLVEQSHWNDFLTFRWRSATHHLLETRALAQVINDLARIPSLWGERRLAPEQPARLRSSGRISRHTEHQRRLAATNSSVA
mgnify:CR=1 FL=1